MRSHELIVVTVLVMSGFAGCEQTSKPEAPTPKTHTVKMEGMVFQPATLTVAPGDTVLWVNKDLVPHAVTTNGPGFESKPVEFNQSLRHAFKNAGDVTYICPFHPTMTGTIHVQ